MNREHPRLRELFLGYLEGSLSALDQQEFWSYVDDPAFEQSMKQILSERFGEEDMPVHLSKDKQRQLLAHIYQYADGVVPVKSRSRFHWLPYAAAALAIAIMATLILYSIMGGNMFRDNRSALVVKEDVLPLGNKATLTLADGRAFDLSESKSGIVMNDNHVVYRDGTHEVVELPTNTIQQLVLTTPRGSTYQLTLPDGSLVWLNAGSTLKYPSTFNDQERLVVLEGEAFFEVSKSQAPFRVQSTHQTVEVLGTLFNVSAYTDEHTTQTTLVEGSVQVVDAHMKSRNQLIPGQQSTLQKNGLVEIKKVDMEQYIAWKDGLFYFQKTPFDDMMRQISKWYDVDVVYKSTIPNYTFSGRMGRNLSLMTVLELLNVSSIQVKLVNNQLIVK